MKSVIFSLFVLIMLFACGSNKPNVNREDKDSVETDTLTNSGIIHPTDNQQQVRQKLLRMAKLDNQEFGELVLFDDYYQGNITKYFLKDFKVDQRNLTLILFGDSLRYLKVLLQHVGDTTAKNIKQNYAKISYAINETIESGTYKIVDNNYLLGNQDGDVWYTTYILTESKKTGRQDYYLLMCPESDLGYLKYMLSLTFNAKELICKFLVNEGSLGKQSMTAR